jgi:hypothetical protein
MSKGADPIDIKKEKERFMALLTAETKRYDVNGMTIDLNQKMDQIVTSIKKEEKIIMNDEERQLRNLDKLEYMSQYLNEDHIHTKDSLKAAQLIREDANLQMSEFESRNQQELRELEDEVRRINQQIEAQKHKQAEIKEENHKLLKSINTARDTDKKQNQGIVDQILMKDRDFDKNEKELEDK